MQIFGEDEYSIGEDTENGVLHIKSRDEEFEDYLLNTPSKHDF